MDHDTGGNDHGIDFADKIFGFIDHIGDQRESGDMFGIALVIAEYMRYARTGYADRIIIFFIEINRYPRKRTLFGHCFAVIFIEHGTP